VLQGLKGWLVVAVPDKYACEPLQLDNNTVRGFTVCFVFMLCYFFSVIDLFLFI
jgi:hypothetical protein